MLKKSKIIITICLIFFIFLLVLIFSTIFALINSNNKLILNGISINNIDISNLNVDDAKEKLNNQLTNNFKNSIILKYNNYERKIIPSEIDCEPNILNSIQMAYKIGRSGNIFENNFTILKSKYTKKNLEITLNYNDKKLNNIIDDISQKIPGLVVDSSYYISDNSLIILNGSDGITLQKEETKNLIIESLYKLSTASSDIIIEPITKNITAKTINIEEIYKNIYSKPENASIQKNPFKLNPGSYGVDFAISLDEAKKMLEQPKSEYIIPLTYTSPEITVSNLDQNDIFPHTLSYSTTKYNESNIERVNNLKIATEKINGLILLPGESFSFNQTVGKRNIENGYKEAVIYANGQAEMGLGGGICQISSTLYNAVVLANLDVIERKNHSMIVSYLNPGLDATVSYGSIDFKFKNSRNYPIRIDATVRNGTVTISIQGIKEETEYNIEMQVEITQTIPFETTYINDNSLSQGERTIVQSGKNGYNCSTYKVTSSNGIIISKTLLSTDFYKSQNCIIHIKK